MTKSENWHSRWKGRINRTNMPNNRQKIIPTIPAININIIIYQWMGALADRSIDTVDGNYASIGSTLPITDITQSQKSQLSISIL